MAVRGPGGERRDAGAAAIELDGEVLGAADDFAQASADGNRALAGEVAAALGPGAGRRLLELYAGAGNLTRHALALGWRVTAVDARAPARPLPGAVHLAGDVARVLADLAGEAFDAVLLDPPRAGAAAAIAPLAGTGAARVVYVSCDPATLGRDLAALAAAGFAPRWAQPLDLMPDTAHVEVVAVLDRVAAPDPGPVQ